jgi:hypothetical protein
LILSSSACAWRFHSRSHVGGQPEVPFGPGRPQRDGGSGGVDSQLVLPPALGLGGMLAEPVAHSGQLPGGLERGWVAPEFRVPEIGRPSGARRILAMGTEHVRIVAGGGRRLRRGADPGEREHRVD